jgi:hypothetical protein
MLALSLTGTKAIIAYIVVIVIVVVAIGMYYTRGRR